MPQMDVNFREDDNFVYADVTGYTPSTELFIEVRSKAVAPNESTEGVTAAVHKTTDDKGATTFRFPKDFMLPDLPRSLTAIGPIDVPQTFKA